jgi:hypothetical protein
LARPVVQGRDRSFKRIPQWCKGIFDAERRIGKDPPCDKAAALKLAQTLGKSLLGNEETRGYFRDFLRLNEETTTVREFFDRMMKLHGDRANPDSLWGGVTAAKARHGSKRASV